jgi:hypothetical protein
VTVPAKRRLTVIAKREAPPTVIAKREAPPTVIAKREAPPSVIAKREALKQSPACRSRGRAHGDG